MTFVLLAYGWTNVHYKPDGFIPGAGHGSTLRVSDESCWHIATMRISVTHNLERRLGLWQAGVDADGELFCDQRFGDWVNSVDKKPWEKPEWMLLSYGKKVAVSSGEGEKRLIDREMRFTRWRLEGSVDGQAYFEIEDKTNAQSDLPHDLIVREGGIAARFIRLTVKELPFSQDVCLSGLRVFGKTEGAAPAPARNVTAVRHGDLDMLVSWSGDDATGHNILWGYSPEKLYHSYMVFGKSTQNIGALLKGESVFVRVDSFNECGVTAGQDVLKVK